MDALHFAYWLRGWAEINGEKAPTAEQWVIINDHLNLVLNKVTPDRKPQTFSVTSTPEKHIDCFPSFSPQIRNEGLICTQTPPADPFFISGNFPVC